VSEWEERLRTELRSESELIAEGSLRPLDLPGSASHRAMTARARHGRRWPGWLTPVAAGAAVAVVIAGTVTVSTEVFGNKGRSKPAATAYTQLPANYAYTVFGDVVNVTRDGGQYSVTGGRYIDVRSTATGNLVTRVWPPKPYNSFFSLSGTADGNTFVFGVERFMGFVGLSSPRNLSLDDSAPVKFIRLHVTPDGHAHLSAVSLPFAIPPLQFPSIALSPDGAELAVAYGGHGQTARAQVVTLATGQVRQWQWPHAAWKPLLQAQGAWTADDRTVVVQEQFIRRVIGKTTRPAPPVSTTSIWLLNNAVPGSSATRLLLRAPAGLSGPAENFITPDGTKFASLVAQPFAGRMSGRFQGAYVMYSARTGKLVSTIWHWTWTGSRFSRTFANPAIAWSDTSGSRLVVLWPFMHANRLAVLIDGTVALGGNHLFPRNHHAYAELQNSMQHAFGNQSAMTW